MKESIGEVERNVRIGDTMFALIVTTQHGETQAITAVHRQDFKRRIGGARFVLRATGSGREEVAHLAEAMTDKCIAALIPADGQKTLIITTPEILESEDRKVQILAEHVKVLSTVDPGVIVGPDMNNSETVQERVAVEHGLMDHMTGLSRRANGLSIDENGYTAQGLIYALEALLVGNTLRGMTVSIQGFGAVGAHAARLLEEHGARLVAASNANGVLFVKNDGALRAAELFQYWQAQGDNSLPLYHTKNPTTTTFSDDPDVLFQIPARIFVPAARTLVLAMPHELEAVRHKENKTAQDVVAFLEKTGVELVLEGANYPLTHEAERYLEKQGVKILPDFIVNCGGLIGCWVEWEQRRNHPNTANLDLQDVDRNALDRVRSTVYKNVGKLVRSGKQSREAARDIVDENFKYLLSRA